MREKEERQKRGRKAGQDLASSEWYLAGSFSALMTHPFSPRKCSSRGKSDTSVFTRWQITCYKQKAFRVTGTAGVHCVCPALTVTLRDIMDRGHRFVRPRRSTAEVDSSLLQYYGRNGSNSDISKADEECMSEKLKARFLQRKVQQAGQFEIRIGRARKA
eukprot:2583819-Rhodomonas_salina.1